MDDPPIYGKPVYRDLRPLARHFPSRLQVRLIGYLPSKQGYVERAGSDRLSFSFILNGGGEYRQGLRTWPVQAPCVVVQRPGVAFRHGPKGEWEELY
ncbi:MAG: hypothetical protein N3A38_16645, partial [Planctomycetota bacterium]|nr:hypothetical protein [Planctomycetota bacterium]